MLNIVVCDDEVIDRKLITAMIKKYMTENHIGAEIKEYESGDEYIAGYDGIAPDMVFLDIYMEGTDGISLARKIREKSSSCQIVFTTSSNEYASDAFEVEALSYLRKPLSEQKVN